ncbi:MAG TPA: hypothetical protein VHH11_13955 [Gammaproteobacteria bacterium]|nr:hypothetical protein [Gammaproteobacteria bacterium]
MITELQLTRKQAILAWHFLPDDGRTSFNHAGRGRVLVHAGKKLVHRGSIVLAERGLHASTRAIDALRYAPGARVCRVACWGDVVRGDDKLACSHRAVLWLADATFALRSWACDVAEGALCTERDAGREPDARSWAAIAVMRRWLRGECDYQALAHAGDAAWAAVRCAMRAGARRHALSGAARVAAWLTMNYDACDVARNVAWDAVFGAANEAAWGITNCALYEAAWDSARNAAWAAENTTLERALFALAPADVTRQPPEQGCPRG